MFTVLLHVMNSIPVFDLFMAPSSTCGRTSTPGRGKVLASLYSGLAQVRIIPLVEDGPSNTLDREGLYRSHELMTDSSCMYYSGEGLSPLVYWPPTL